MKYFDHEKLDVYQASIELVILIDEIVDLFPRGRELLIRIVSMLTKMVQGNTGAEIKIEEAIMRSTS